MLLLRPIQGSLPKCVEPLRHQSDARRIVFPVRAIQESVTRPWNDVSIHTRTRRVKFACKLVARRPHAVSLGLDDKGRRKARHVCAAREGITVDRRTAAEIVAVHHIESPARMRDAPVPSRSMVSLE